MGEMLVNVEETAGVVEAVDSAIDAVEATSFEFDAAGSPEIGNLDFLEEELGDLSMDVDGGVIAFEAEGEDVVEAGNATDLFVEDVGVADDFANGSDFIPF